MKEKIKVNKVILVEGKYDKIKLSSIIDGCIMTTGGFSIFNNEEKCALLRKLAKQKGIVILTDSDGAGFVIRNKLKGIIGSSENIINLYSPQISGKESRKNKSSKQGFLGVEGIDSESLFELFEKSGLISENGISSSNKYTKAQLYSLGFSGQENSSSLRDGVCELNGLPKGMSCNAFLEAVNILGISLE